MAAIIPPLAKSRYLTLLVILFIIFTIQLQNASSSSFMPFRHLNKHSLYLPGPPAQGDGQHGIVKRAAPRIILPPDIDRPFIKTPIRISNFNVQSDIRYRYSTTYFSSTVTNEGSTSGEVNFQVVLPETGFISKFVLEVDGKLYEAFVIEKKTAKRIYEDAQMRGQSAGLVELNSRFSNIFNVDVNIHSRTSVTFNLTYEELLQRKLGRYEQIINVSPNQVRDVEDVGIVITIEETNKIKNIESPQFRYGDQLGDDSRRYEIRDIAINRHEVNKARIIWRPSSSELESLKQTNQVGKFSVKYEVESVNDAGEVLVMNGYFVYFFAPPNLRPLKKHVVFILDISGSMTGRKIEQLKEAMNKILDDLKPEDYFNILVFSTAVSHWTPRLVLQYRDEYPFEQPRYIDEDRPSREPFSASSDNIRKAQNFIKSLRARGGTNIDGALSEGLALTGSLTRSQSLPLGVQSMIIFLTDGEPTVGTIRIDQILRNVRSSNEAQATPLFSLAFGTESDFNFLRLLSLQNFGFARKIYEASDSKLQLEGFYKEISSPILKKIRATFKDVAGGRNNYEIYETTKYEVNTFFDGDEIVIAGRIRPKATEYGAYESVRPGLNSVDSKSPLRKASSVSEPSSSGGGVSAFNPNGDLFYWNSISNNCYFPISIYGCGRDNKCSTWNQPRVWSYRRWPWRCPPPPGTMPTRPPVRPEPTREDFFLERYWAYLTIQQLIDKDFASSGDDGSSVTSDSRQKALQLALQYGFVTPLTSLVVVKPEETYREYDPVAIDDFSKQSESGAGASSHSGKIRRMSFTKRVGFASPTFSKGSISLAKESARPQYVKTDGAEAFTGGLAPGAPTANGGIFRTDRPDQPPVTSSPATTSSPPRTTTIKTDKSKPESSTSGSESSPKYELKDMKLDSAIRIVVNGQFYDIAKNTATKDMELVDKECTIDKTGAIKIVGQCKHLKDCIQSEFVNNLDLYKKSYFCEAETKASKKKYAGACCPS